MGVFQDYNTNSFSSFDIKMIGIMAIIFISFVILKKKLLSS